MSNTFSGMKIGTSISLGVVLYTAICTITFISLALWDSKKNFDNIIKQDLNHHFDIIYPIAGSPTGSLDKLSQYFDTYQKRHHIDIALYNIVDGKTEPSLSTFGNQPLLDSSVYPQAKENNCEVMFIRHNSQHLAVCNSAIPDEYGNTVAVLEVVKNLHPYDTALLNSAKRYIAFGAVAILFSIIVTRLISHSITWKITELTRLMNIMSKGDSHVNIPLVNHNNEMGNLARALRAMKEYMKEFERITEIRAMEENAKQEHEEHIASSIRTFNQDSSSVIHHVTLAVAQIKSVAENVSGIAKQAYEAIQKTLSTSGDLSHNVENVAVSAEQLSTSIQEIDRQVLHSIDIARQAVRDINHTNQNVTGLSGAVEKIGINLSTISDIADQANLLALNATIEAARAGDAGKGFSVVAHEMKQLAQQMEKAAQEISTHIQTMQSNSTDAVQAIQNVSQVIEEIDKISATIALTIQEQGKAAEDIAHHLMEAADGTQKVNGTISGVAEVTQETTHSSHQILEVARSLFDHGQALQNTLQSFIQRINAEKVA